MNENFEVVVTGPKDWMKKIALEIVEQRMAACVHLAAINSYYWWGGAIENANETRASFHTRGEKVSELVDFIERVHPYKVPCAISFRIIDGAGSYQEWISKETE